MVTREIIVFCYGDSESLSTWSNVPYLMTQELLRRGIIIHRVDILPGRFFRSIYNRIIWRMSKIILPDNKSNDLRSPLCKIIIDRKIKKAVMQYPNASFCLFFCYDYYNRFNSIPSVLFSDWTFKYLLENRYHKEHLNPLERRFVNQQAVSICNSTFVFSLFKSCSEVINKDYPTANIIHLKRNVINNTCPFKISEEQIIFQKKRSNRILFIGGKNYLEGALQLIESADSINNEETKYCLDIIGLSESDIGEISHDSVHCYGYLDKSNADDNFLYYDLLTKAGVVVNTTPRWAGYSSIIEALYFYTPVIISPFEEIVNEFGSNNQFINYHDSDSTNDLGQQIVSLLQREDYPEICVNAHSAVKDYTWGKYIDEFLTAIEGIAIS